MTKKQKYTLIMLLVILCAVIVGLTIWLHVPRAVVEDPEHTTITDIQIQKKASEQKNPEDNMSWYGFPRTEEEKAIGEKIVQYLAQCTEKRTLRTNKHLGEFPADWKCIYLELSENGEERVILLGPVGADTQFYHGQVNISYNLSDGSFSDQYQGDLEDPDDIRAFILNALDLPEDFCRVETE